MGIVIESPGDFPQATSPHLVYTSSDSSHVHYSLTSTVDTMI